MLCALLQDWHTAGHCRLKWLPLEDAVVPEGLMRCNLPTLVFLGQAYHMELHTSRWAKHRHKEALKAVERILEEHPEFPEE